MSRRVPAPLPLLLLLCACAHLQNEGRAQALRPAVETFHEALRWGDLRTVAEQVVPERREAFERARRAGQDAQELSVTDYELLEMELAPEAETARVVSRVQWMRLPSVTVQSEEVRSEFVWREGRWLLARQEGGPFAAELSAPLK